ncbi:hypothetical protein K503DRAFT_806861 [Rhizopogon vinicolor AM-OR11-026]|uniref:Uncharacterized protein n=1 Tax=Rhizopogon vinicolor AM-OR11-026 TaxID=1314800 RepID=A0A1B7MDN6_9AGAM|nr:hypothetical protein K503DRAFT_806861 [Rhizopogon vinicolor AM-OR11-026]
MSDIDCAIGSDSHLKDASEIKWFNDPDDKEPLSSPTEKKTGAQCSSQASRPSTMIIDPNNVASASSTRGKHKAGDGPVTMHRVARRKVIPTSSASSDDGGHVSDIDTAEGADTEADEHASEDDVGDAYASTKAMGDVDRESGATHHLKSECMADVRIVFIKKDDYVDSHTGLVESGHVCTVCQKNGVAARHCFFKGSMSTGKSSMSLLLACCC